MKEEEFITMTQIMTLSYEQRGLFKTYTTRRYVFFILCLINPKFVDVSR